MKSSNSSRTKSTTTTTIIIITNTYTINTITTIIIKILLIIKIFIIIIIIVIINITINACHPHNMSSVQFVRAACDVLPVQQHLNHPPGELCHQHAQSVAGTHQDGRDHLTGGRHRSRISDHIEGEVKEGTRDGLDRELGTYVMESISSLFSSCSRQREGSREEEETDEAKMQHGQAERGLSRQQDEGVELQEKFDSILAKLMQPDVTFTKESFTNHEDTIWRQYRQLAASKNTS
ncbi:hypothetical protein ElyMa_002488400 [Elysia marginata]|uniref:Uncharacterized protein n=1 Tax=Elysia marginata TaxID=1093978 RepID=A0AAV4GPP7_9GAST|nr:hypothetical protein ElyMa_002488400 [Elysia marginata]